MDVLNHVTHKQIAKAMGVSVAACYKVKYANPKRYELTALTVILNKVTPNELLMGINFILAIKKRKPLPTVERHHNEKRK